MPGTWSPAPNQADLYIGTVVLLTDGTLLAQDNSTVNWWRLCPTQAGDYAGGTWVQTAPAHRPRQFFASAVLADGRVLVAFGTPAGQPAAEIYDPVANAWTVLAPPDSWGVLDEAPCCVLPNGTVLIGNIATGQCALFDPAQNAWRPAATKRNRAARGETWTLLQDGSVLAIDCAGHPAAERYIDGEWQSAGTMLARFDLVEASSLDTGPAILRADGNVIAFGATPNTATFKPDPAPAKTGSWQAGPALPVDAGRQLVAKDAPACLLPNGNILLLLTATSGAAGDYGATSIPYEFDGAVFTPAGPPHPKAPRDCRLLVLPNGQVMLAASSQIPSFYTPVAPTAQAWFPAINHVPGQLVPGASVLLRGLRLNGMSQACAFGDDAGMATNYPLVRLTSKATPKTVTYCRTYGHSTMGVATGTSEHSTNFVVPDGVAVGDYDLEVVVNGVASPSRLVTVKLAAPAARVAAAAATPSYRDVDDDRAMQEEMFWRDLNEVHLLMDYISGRADKSLSDLKDVLNPDSTAGNSAATLSAPDALQRVCLIRFPPDSSPEKKASDAALLLLVKDRLNALSAPARGLSVAFTAMFAGTAGRSPNRWMARLGRYLVEYLWGPEMVKTDANGKPIRKPHVTGFAIASYPNLEGRATFFRILFRFLPSLAIIWVILTALTSWDVAMSSRVLQRQAADLAVAAKAGATTLNCKIVSDNNSFKFADGTTNPTDACNALLRTKQPFDYADEEDRRALFINNWRPHLIGRVVHRYLGPGQHAPSQPAKPVASRQQAADASRCTGADPCEQDQGVWAFAGIVVAVFTNDILPMMFGVLGTLAGVIRAIIGKVKESTLSPRDMTLTFSLLPLGAVAGLAVGLIVTPGNAQTGATALTLPAAGLAFLAGYGADAFFAMVDGLLARVFATNGTPASGSK